MASNIRNRVKEFRIKRSWTQQDLAEKVGVTRQSIISIELNRYAPGLSLALMFARIFGCSIEEIFTLKN
jgi:DNA-binding XRE family transcriptional regulator